MIIGITGFGNTGASALFDYLKGYGIHCLIKGEFQFLYQMDGIDDLRYYLTQKHERIPCGNAIKRFIRVQKNSLIASKIRKVIGKDFDKLTKEYLQTLIDIQWKGEPSFADPNDISNRPNNQAINQFLGYLDKILKKISNKFHFFPYQQKYFSMISEKQFDDATKIYLNKLFMKLGYTENSTCIIDMLFSATTPQNQLRYLDNAKGFLVVRDPRDIWVSVKKYPQDSRFMPNVSVSDFIIYYQKIMDNLEPNENINVVHYEDLIYKYEETTDYIKKHLAIEGTAKEEFKYFNPLISVKYTHRVDLYGKYSDDIKIIEKELKPFLYDFMSAVNPLDNIALKKKINSKQIKYEGLNID